MLKKIIIVLSTIRLIPHLFLFYFHKEKKIIHYDLRRWLSVMKKDKGLQKGFIELMTFNPEFRNLFYYRIGFHKWFISWLCPKLSSLRIKTNSIGPGLFIQHGFCTTIGAKSIGKDCWINQQVTIGFSNEFDSPCLGDNVTIYAGAKIIGNLKMGNNSIAGANAVITKDVPENCTVAGVPAVIIRRNGQKIRENL